MSVPIRGIVEGFYGRLWTWTERRRVARTAAEAGFTTYVYAPKEEPRQNGEWRRGYRDATRRGLRAFAAACQGSGLELWIGLRPVGISYADDRDADRVAERVIADRGLGGTRTVLLADDIPQRLDERAGNRFSSLAEAHAWLIDRVLDRAELDPGQLVFVPTDYHGHGSPYLAELGAAIHRDVDLCWTGPGVFATTISATDAERVARVIGRRPLVWDNYPVNDEEGRHELRIGPIRGRPADMLAAVRGVLVNPAMEPEASLVALLTWGDLLESPATYDPDASWSRAVRRVAGSEDDAAAVTTLAAALDRSVLEQRWVRPSRARLQAAIDRLPGFRNRRLAAELSAFVDPSPRVAGGSAPAVEAEP